VDSSGVASNFQRKSKWDRNGEANLKTTIMELLESKSNRITPAGLTRALRHYYPDLAGSLIRQTIKSLVENGDLTYADRFGRTHIEMNYLRVRPITDRITLMPPNCTPDKRPDEVLIKINPGASFGMGDHPTTRIALRGVEYAMTRVIPQCKSRPITTLDIGTGSGVLAIASIKLGATKAYGLDLDPVACHEARNNVVLNGLDSSINIQETDLDRFDGGCCELLIANLRPPTLKQIIPTLNQFSSASAAWVFSGFRDEEVHGLENLLTSISANVIWQYSEYGWSGIVVTRDYRIGK
jgi:ribosomal protein L11 methyltransferase